MACACVVFAVSGAQVALAASAPTVSTGGAQAVSTTSATLTGTVNPNGQATSYQFEYGTTTTYGAQTSMTSAGNGTTDLSVSASIGSLSPNTTYHYRILATNASGPASGADRTFTTPAAQPPAAGTGNATSVTATSATLTGSVNPRGQPTTYSFQYGPTTAYGAHTAQGNAGNGTGNVSASGTVGSLSPSTTYHYRILAANASGTTFGADRTFTTARPSPTAPAVTTGGAKSITGSSATLTGTVNPKTGATTYYFQYGTSTAYTRSTPTANAGSGTRSVRVSRAVGSLSPSTTYHYRIVASNASGTTVGADRTFTTARPYRLTLAASRGTIVAGDGTTLAGTVTGPKPLRTTVILQRARSALGPFFTVRTTTSSRRGTFAFAVRPSATVYFRALANGAATPPVRVAVRWRVRLFASTTRPRRGQVVHFHGRVFPAHNGRRVMLQRLAADHRWHTIRWVRLHPLIGNRSRYSVFIRVHRDGLWRAVLRPGPRHARGFSPVLQIHLRRG